MKSYLLMHIYLLDGPRLPLSRAIQVVSPPVLRFIMMHNFQAPVSDGSPLPTTENAVVHKWPGPCMIWSWSRYNM